MNEELKETAKAVQELSKTANSALEITKMMGKFVGNLVSEPFEEIIGILTDNLKFIRWKRQVRLAERIKEFIKANGLNKFRMIPPKFALPLIENASIEENDELQDLWAKLLVTSIDPTKEFPRQGFIDIIKQLEAIDVQILKFIYDEYSQKTRTSNKIYFLQNSDEDDPTRYAIFLNKILNELKIDKKIYYSAVDNLMRMRLVTYHIWSKSITSENIYDTVSSIAGYDVLAITSLGVDFVKACIE
jgi:Abortive infection alpha